MENKAAQMDKVYNPQAIEGELYKEWEETGAFVAHREEGKKPFTIVMPPPNITGQLHMGHAMDGVLQDSLTRYHRMKGDPTLWLPGTDHASIATEVKIVEAMRKEGLDKHDVGREEFLRRAWAWKNEYGGRIVRQTRRMGNSCDWSRERFTMDEGCSKAVTEVFNNLYEKGLIYRGNRMVNWCPCCNTSISDAEVEYQEQEGHFWHLLYTVKETGEQLELATTRPETMLGDTAVAINENDPRYAHLHGCHVILPLMNIEIPIVCDEHADMEKGTGVVKITPAHDPNDFEVGQRHNLPIVRVFTYDGHMTGAKEKAENDALFASGKATVGEPRVIDCGKYAGMTTMEARKAIVKDLEAGGYLKSVEPLKHEVGTCYRCHTTIEPMVSKQWFVKMEPLAKPAIECVRNGEVRFVPERFAKNYIDVDGEHPRLVHLPPALVGPPHPGVVLRRLRRGHRRARNADRLPEVRLHAPDAGRGRAGYLVLLRAVAVLHARLAGADRRPVVFLPDQRAGDGLRHHLLLGRPHDLLRHRADGQAALPHRADSRPRARRAGPQDEQVAGQRHRSAGGHRPVRRGRAALLAGHGRQPRKRHALLRRTRSNPPATLPTRSGTRARFVLMNLRRRGREPGRQDALRCRQVDSHPPERHHRARSARQL